ncbi:MAG: hypothetical protein M3Q99_06945 [Acidobacteriota bacterium]|nr:hypothetical protein [Acidobacteriota bacterium]
MRNIKQFFNLNILLAILLSLASNVSARNEDFYTPKNKAALDYSILADNLSEKLKVELSENNLKIKFGNVQEVRIANNLIKIKGEAFCVLPTEDTQLPINFEAKVNTLRRTVDEVQYKFVETNYAPSADEEVLIRELMKQISRDYKTDRITIAIDGFDANAASDNQKQLTGVGEIKIGEVEWSKINFDVILNAAKKATKITYDIK